MTLVNLFILLCGWSFLGFIALFLMSLYNPRGLVGRAREWEFVHPKYIHRKLRRVNWFGATVIALFYNLLCPMCALTYWFYKLCTYGRK